MKRCPNCRARDDGADHCRRCGMALEPLRRVEAAAEGELRAAVRRLAEGDPAAAERHTACALALHRTPLGEALAGFIAQPAAALASQPEPAPPAEPAPEPPPAPEPWRNEDGYLRHWSQHPSG